MPDKQAVREAFSMSQLLTSLGASMGACAIGFCSAYTSPALTTMRDANYTGFELTDNAASWVGSSMPLAAVISGLCALPIVHFLGLRHTFHLTAIPMIVGWILLSTAHALYMVYIARAVNGVGVGLLALTLPLYLSETLHPTIRGALGIMPSAFGNLGMLSSFSIGWMTKWRQQAIAGAISCLPYAILLFFMKESPRWYLSKGKNEKALKALTWLRPKNADVNTEIQEMEATAAKNSNNACRELFHKQYIRPLYLTLGLMFIQQCTGINAVIFYSVMIFHAAASTIDDNLCTIIVGCVNFTGAFVATAVIDLVGRKVLLYISVTVMFITLVTLSVYMAHKDRFIELSILGWLPLASFIIYVLGYAMGLGPIPYLMMGELIPMRIRIPAGILVISFNWLCTFIVTKTFQNMIDVIQVQGAFAVFCLVCVFGFFFILFLVPETKGKSLEEIEEEMTK